MSVLKNVINMNNKTEPYLSDFLLSDKMSQLQKECLSARYHLFYHRDVGFDYNYMSFAPVGETMEEERRINNLSDNIVRFTFYSHRSLSFQIGESTKRYNIKVSHNFGACDAKDTTKTNPYLKVSKELAKAVIDYDTMVSFYNSFDWASFANRMPSGDDYIVNDASWRTYAKRICDLTCEIPLDYFHFTPLRMLYNECVRSVSHSISLMFDVDECSRIYCHFVNEEYEGTRNILRNYDSFEKYLDEEFYNFNHILKMKDNNTLIPVNTDSIEANVNVDVNLIVSYLLSDMDENSLLSRFCKSIKFTLSKVLESTTNNVLSCTIVNNNAKVYQKIIQ